MSDKLPPERPGKPRRRERLGAFRSSEMFRNRPMPPPDPEAAEDQPEAPEPPPKRRPDAVRHVAVPLPAAVWERAWIQAQAAGFGSIEGYAAFVLTEAINRRGESVRIDSDVEVMAILDEPPAEESEGISATLIDWGPSLDVEPIEPPASGEEIAIIEPEPEPEPKPEPSAGAPPMPAPRRSTYPETPRTVEELAPAEAVAIVLRHAAGDPTDPSGFLTALRRAEAPTPTAVRELLTALRALERSAEEAPWLGRRLAFALHRLAFEGQVLITDAWPGVPDPETTAALRAVQEGVDRVLSGDDISYDRLANR